MTGLYIVLGLLLALWLISRIRVGGVAEYSAQGAVVWLRVGPFRLELFPGKPGKEPKKPKPKKGKEKKEKKAPEEPEPALTEKLGGALALFQELLPIALDAVEKLLHRLRVDELVLHLTIGAQDPADAAMGYGAGQAVLGAIWPQLERVLEIKKQDVGVAVDFQAQEPVVYARGSLSLTVGQAITLGLACGLRALRAFLRVRRSRRRAGAHRFSRADGEQEI